MPHTRPHDFRTTRCLTCGTDNDERECPDWCPAMQGACDCRQPTCGWCMRARHDGRF